MNRKVTRIPAITLPEIREKGKQAEIQKSLTSLKCAQQAVAEAIKSRLDLIEKRHDLIDRKIECSIKKLSKLPGQNGIRKV